MSVDLNLSRLAKLLPQFPYTRPTLHVAGTNGKGSVASILYSILRSSSLSVGRYNSPHLVSIYDCIVVNDEPVDPTSYVIARADVEKADREEETKLTSFEILTLTALLVFQRAMVDVVVLEVGMGGRLDATNIVPDPTILASVLTSVDLDHQAFLGNTVSAIAKEKAGIARAGKPFILGPQKHTDVEDVVKQVVSQVGGEILRSVPIGKRDWDEDVDGPPPFPLHGEHQLDNLGAALAAISALLTHPQPNFKLQSHITPQVVAQGIKETRWPGRLSFHVVPASDNRSLVVLADGAHNPASSATLGAYVTELLSSLSTSSSQTRITITYILALSHSPPKTPLQTLLPLLPPKLNSNIRAAVEVAVLRFSPPEGMPWVKSVSLQELAGVVRQLVPRGDVWVADDDEDPSQQLEKAVEWAGTTRRNAEEGEGHLVVLAGSLYLVADFYRLLARKGLSP
ncbi:hypothetical protein K443DRAFT_100614 [Laccaria amethystina LaAM-08-1]|uniref:Mur ligase central domain-containing protein n=1 Tax=Laccaria amethystina LaAM-08-1 TaxID=1095629 RepID=A0A0C9X5M7_9AGAR|nr:hypothetical protein K443DRAFT_100614 [Laccaria amethystina LaAM-08-1]